MNCCSSDFAIEGVCLNPLGGIIVTVPTAGFNRRICIQEMGERRDGEGKRNGQGRRDKKRKPQ